MTSNRVAHVVAIATLGLFSPLFPRPLGPSGAEAPDLEARVAALEMRMTTVEQRLARFEENPDQVPEQPAAAERAVVEITAPEDGATVGVNVLVQGIVRVDDLAGRWPVVAVHPIMGNMTWVQPLPVKIDKVGDGFRFNTRAYCGTPTQGRGEPFEIVAFLAEKGAYKEGDQLSKLPEDIPMSATVLVTRD